ncbi:hypothetical protein [Corynebacterium sp.]|uniref:hypothetical protein n=1 Tax=Corynebacterium sp. TaxID=1720 RepID=UPI0026DCA59B|nr:hypothetical protein [Corynebacterium sp.]MDO5077694.1 hypothetical protein [Corynebacterium sp.]
MNTTRIAGAGLAAVITALPDYVHNAWVRRALTASLIAGGIYMINTDENPDNDITWDRLELDGTEDGPVTTWLKIGGVATALYASAKADAMLAKGLRKVGIRKPYTVLGLVAGAVVYDASAALVAK